MTAENFQTFWTSREKPLVFRKVLMMATFGLVLGVITPYETSNITSPVGRYLYWVGCVLAPALISGLVGRRVFPLLQQKRLNLAGTFLAYTAVMSVPTSLWVEAWEIILKGLFVQPGDFLPFASGRLAALDHSLTSILTAYLRVWIIMMLIVGPVSLIGDRMLPRQDHPALSRPGDRFLARLPAALGTDILCLSMEDHYVRAHTALGDTLILMRMADAIAELDGIDGAQVHRSWWVAADAIEMVERAPRKISLRLRNGLLVPISQRRVKGLKESGFLQKF